MSDLYSGEKRVWGRLFTGFGHNDNLAQEFDFARRFANINNGQDPESMVGNIQLNREETVEPTSEKFVIQFGDGGREKLQTSSELFDSLRAKLDTIVSSNPGHFVPEINEIEDEEPFQQGQRGERLFEILDLKPDRTTTAPKKRRKLTFLRRITDGKLVRDPRELLEESEMPKESYIQIPE